ncbi:MAG: DUF4339 domain-containing protein [Opitutaceae bacterium]|jgi:hypothetical protein
MTYYVAIRGVKKDPMPEATLRAMIADGAVGADALCWREGWSNWQPVATAFPGLFPGHVAPAHPAPIIPAITTAAMVPPADAETVRKQYLTHEASLKSVGTLYFLGSFLMLAAGAVSICGLMPNERQNQGMAYQVGFGLFLIVIGALQFQVGRWLRVLNPNALTPATIFSALGLLGFPLGTLINGYILYLLRSKKGDMVFSESYGEVITATPHIKYKTSLLVWIFLGLLLLMIGFAMVGMLAGTRHR